MCCPQSVLRASEASELHLDVQGYQYVYIYCRVTCSQISEFLYSSNISYWNSAGRRVLSQLRLWILLWFSSYSRLVGLGIFWQIKGRHSWRSGWNSAKIHTRRSLQSLSLWPPSHTAIYSPDPLAPDMRPSSFMAAGLACRETLQPPDVGQGVKWHRRTGERGSDKRG